jgi:hypothetical protein
LAVALRRGLADVTQVSSIFYQQVVDFAAKKDISPFEVRPVRRAG